MLTSRSPFIPPPIRVKQDGLSVQGPVLQTLDRPTGVHESFRSSLSLGPLTWGPPTVIPGRLADPGLLGGQDQTARKPTPLALPLPRDSHKRAEVRPLPVEYLGMTIDTISAWAWPTEARIQKFLTLARNFLSQPNPPAQRWQVLLGHMSSLEKLVPRARLRMRSLQWHLKFSWSTESCRLFRTRSPAREWQPCAITPQWWRTSTNWQNATDNFISSVLYYWLI